MTNILITGGFNFPIRQYAEEKGFTASSVELADHVVVGKNPSAPRVSLAQQLNKQVLTEKEFMILIGYASVWQEHEEAEKKKAEEEARQRAEWEAREQAEEARWAALTPEQREQEIIDTAFADLFGEVESNIESNVEQFMHDRLPWSMGNNSHDLRYNLKHSLMDDDTDEDELSELVDEFVADVVGAATDSVKITWDYEDELEALRDEVIAAYKKLKMAKELS
jgi:hypothetical protein